MPEVKGTLTVEGNLEIQGDSENKEEKKEDNDYPARWAFAIIFLVVVLAVSILLLSEKGMFDEVGRATVHAWILGLTISIVCGNLVTGRTVAGLRKRIPVRETAGRFVCGLGALESFAYTIAWVSGYPHFIPTWLAVKFINRWNTDEGTQKRGVINTFLIGNLLNVLFSVAGGALIKYLAPIAK